MVKEKAVTIQKYIEKKHITESFIVSQSVEIQESEAKSR